MKRKIFDDAERELDRADIAIDDEDFVKHKNAQKKLKN